MVVAVGTADVAGTTAVVVAAVAVVVVVVADTSAGTTAVALAVDVVDVVTLQAWQRVHHVSFSYVDTYPFVVRMILYKNHTWSK